MSNPPEDTFQAAFWAAKRALFDASEAAFARHGVRPGQQFILQALWAEDGLTPGEIARRVRLATPTVTKTATRMASAGLVVREPHPSDARLVRIRLTPRGRQLRRAIAAERRRLTDRALAGLSEKSRTLLVRCLQQIRLNLVEGA
jgi:MarR family transcriptional regulator, organic hydroperoxide resistance regulator